MTATTHADVALSQDAATFARTLANLLVAGGWHPRRDGSPWLRCPLTRLEARPLTAHCAHLRRDGVPGLALVGCWGGRDATGAALDVAAQLEARRKQVLREVLRAHDG